MSLISKSSEYGLRASLYVAARKEAGFVPIREISNRLDISFHFLTKILQRLTEQGIMHSYRGPSGGVSLTKSAAEISLHDIVHAIEGGEMFTSCILGLEGCGEKTPCPLHHHWAKERIRIETMFKDTTLDQAAKLMNKNELRITDL